MLHQIYQSLIHVSINRGILQIYIKAKKQIYWCVVIRDVAVAVPGMLLENARS